MIDAWKIILWYLWNIFTSHWTKISNWYLLFKITASIWMVIFFCPTYKRNDSCCHKSICVFMSCLTLGFWIEKNDTWQGISKTLSPQMVLVYLSYKGKLPNSLSFKLDIRNLFSTFSRFRLQRLGCLRDPFTNL